MINYENVPVAIQESVRKFVAIPKKVSSMSVMLAEGYLTKEDVDNLVHAPRSRQQTNNSSSGWIAFEIDGVERSAYPLTTVMTDEERAIYNGTRKANNTGVKRPRGQKKLSKEEEVLNEKVAHILGNLDIIRDAVKDEAALAVLDDVVAETKSLKVQAKSSLLEKFFGVSSPDDLPETVSYNFVTQRQNADPEGDFITDEEVNLLFNAKKADIPEDFNGAFNLKEVKDAVKKLADAGIVDMSNRITGFAMNM
jgi:hypothetical protein